MILLAQNNNLTRGLIAHWPLNELAGSVAFESGQGRNQGTIIGSPSRATGKSGKSTNALDFAGGIGLPTNTGEAVQCGTATELQVDFPFSIVCDAFIDSYVDYASMVAFIHDTAATESGYGMGIWGTGGGTDQYYAALKTTAFAMFYAFSGGPDPTGQWHTYIHEYDGLDQRMFEDGVVVASSTGWLSSSVDYTPLPNAFEIGRFFDDDEERNFDGRIQNVRVYNRILSAAEKTQLENVAA